MARPFLCGKCGNWYTPLNLGPDNACGDCAEDLHARHPKTNEIDCHYGHISAHPSEIKVMGFLAKVQLSVRTNGAALEGIKAAMEQEKVVAYLTRVETAFAEAERVAVNLPETLRWAGVMEMPGMKGEESTKRFKSIEALEEMVKNNRRPPEDLAELRRSVKVCEEIAAEIPPLLAEARMGVAQVRQVAEAWRPPEKPPLYVKEPKGSRVAIPA